LGRGSKQVENHWPSASEAHIVGPLMSVHLWRLSCGGRQPVDYDWEYCYATVETLCSHCWNTLLRNLTLDRVSGRMT